MLRNEIEPIPTVKNKNLNWDKFMNKWDSTITELVNTLEFALLE